MAERYLRTERYLFVVTCATGSPEGDRWGLSLMRCHREFPPLMNSGRLLQDSYTPTKALTPLNTAAANFLQEWKFHACMLIYTFRSPFFLRILCNKLLFLGSGLMHELVSWLVAWLPVSSTCTGLRFLSLVASPHRDQFWEYGTIYGPPLQLAAVSLATSLPPRKPCHDNVSLIFFFKK